MQGLETVEGLQLLSMERTGAVVLKWGSYLPSAAPLLGYLATFTEGFAVVSVLGGTGMLLASREYAGKHFVTCCKLAQDSPLQMSIVLKLRNPALEF